MTMARFQEDSPAPTYEDNSEGLFRQIHVSRPDESWQEGNGDLTHGAKNVLLQEGFCCISVVAFNTTLSALDYVLISKLEVNQFK